MSAAPDTRACQRLDPWLTAYLDGELDAVHALEVEEHLEACERCTEYLATLLATRASLRRTAPMRAPAALHERARLALALERDRGASRAGRGKNAREPEAQRNASGASERPRAQLVKLRFVLPLAAAATLALVLGAIGLREHAAATAPTAPSEASSASVYAASLDSLIDDLVSQHAHPPPPETTDPAGLERFDPYLGVRVRTPAFDKTEARYVGARMQQRGALLQYVVRDRHRLTLYVFDPRAVPVRADRLESRRIGARRILVGHIRGYSVAASEGNGIGYVLATDLDDQESARLLMMAAR